MGETFYGLTQITRGTSVKALFLARDWIEPRNRQVSQDSFVGQFNPDVFQALTPGAAASLAASSGPSMGVKLIENGVRIFCRQ
jgi:hypothetical protein